MRSANGVAGIAILVLIAVVIGLILEETSFNTGGFDNWDAIAQSLGAAMAGTLALLLLRNISPIAELGFEVWVPLLWWLFAMLCVGIGLASFGMIQPLLDRMGRP